MGAIAALAAVELARRGTFTVPGMAKLKVVKKAATKARSGHQPVHQAADDLQGQARAEAGEDPRRSRR